MPFGRPFQGDFLGRAVPRAEAPGLFSVRPSGAWNTHKKIVQTAEARSAWGCDAARPRLGGTVEVMASPTDICRRNCAQAASETLGTAVEKFEPDDIRPSVQSSRWDEVIFLMIPGTSCRAPKGLEDSAQA